MGLDKSRKIDAEAGRCHLKIINALVIDGSGKPGEKADIAVESDRIVAPGTLPISLYSTHGKSLIKLLSNTPNYQPRAFIVFSSMVTWSGKMGATRAGIRVDFLVNEVILVFMVS